MSKPNDLLHPREALQRVLLRCPSAKPETVELADATGRYLFDNVVARDDHPPFPASTMDGFAVVAADVSPWREITGEQAAGPQLPLEVSEGYAVKIMTGAPIPAGADAVIPIEQVTLSEDHVVIEDVTLKPGLNIRPVGSDLARGQRVIESGTPIGSVELGLIATMGYAEVSVARRPQVAVISTGDELVDPGADLAPGMIRDSNRFSLVAAIEAAGAEVVHSSRVGDTVEELRRRLADLDGQIDVLVTSGGVSVGDRDVVKLLLGETANVHFRRVFMKPGRPLTFATSGDLMIFGLPGNPVSSMVSFELFVRPALLSMMGATHPLRETTSVALASEIRPSDRIEFQRATITVAPNGRLKAETTGNQISSRLASLLGANGLLIIEPGTEPIAPGQMVPAILIDIPKSTTPSPLAPSGS
ncbi:MAG TPA: gephyrin-like molybdotransferase Glp [Thermomicrobiales bacterium]|nr:gephyrin-like molybdotransferase Glp [Thermomicrobiales bacterium]